MAQNTCECHCGTRIDLDQQLLQEREMWKQKYLCLQNQFKIDIQILKQNIYAECAGIMQQEFSQKQLDHNKTINQKNVQIKDLIARIVNLETQVKVLSKQKQILQHRNKQIQAQVAQRQQIINGIKSKSSKSNRDWELKHEEQIANLRQRLTAQAKQTIDKLEAQRDILKQKLKQFEVKYQKIIPQIEKMKNCLTQKNAQNEQLLNTIQKLKKKQQDDQIHHSDKYEDLIKIHTTCSRQIKNLSDRNQDLEREIQKCKKISKDVRVQAVYIDRPVQVQKVVEKIVEVQKIVNKYVDNPNNDKRVKSLQQDNIRLKDELNNVLRQIKEIEDHFHKNSGNYEEIVKQHQKNTSLYKKQREALAHRISEQNKQIEMLNSFIQKLGSQKASRSAQGDGEKIVVHVKQDGTYQKTVEKLPAPSTGNGKRKK